MSCHLPPSQSLKSFIFTAASKVIRSNKASTNTDIQEQAYLLEVEWRLFGSWVKKNWMIFFAKKDGSRSLDPPWLKNDAQMMMAAASPPAPIFLGSERIADFFSRNLTEQSYKSAGNFRVKRLPFTKEIHP